MSDIDLKHIARLSRLHLSDAELRFFETQVSQILSFVDKLKEVNVDGVEPTSHPLSLSNVFREDQNPHESGKYTVALLEEVPKKEKNYLKVKKILPESK